MPDEIAPTSAYYIKLGRGGCWEAECLRDGIVRFGYAQTPHDWCLQGRWHDVRELWLRSRRSGGAATSDLNQIRSFYEADQDTLWITFSGGMLWWCFAEAGVEPHPDGQGRFRRAVGGWRSVDVNGNALTADRLSGSLLRVQAFRGTICKVSAFDYLVRRLNGQLLPVVQRAQHAEEALIEALVPLMRLLKWQDFELLVDLVFAASGWRRLGVVGKSQKTVDLELVLPSTGERAFVQIKSSASDRELEDYLQRLGTSGAYDRMFFVWHTGEVSGLEDDRVTIIPPRRLARMVLDAGLVAWLREKVA